MNSNCQSIQNKVACCLLMIIATAGSVCAYEVSIGGVAVSPGASVKVPVVLDTAAEVAVIQFQINYDPQLLTLLSVTNAPDTLGSVFTLQYENNDGVVIVILYRETGLASGAGSIAALEFSANSGAEIDMESALTLAEVSLGNQKGKDLAWDAPISVADGRIQICTDARADCDGDGIPDVWEERYFGGSTNADSSAICSNRINTVRQAYIAGLDPHDPDSQLRITFRSKEICDWDAVSGRVYSVYWTTNLMAGFQCLESNIPWTRGNFTNQPVEPCGYYRIDVRLEE